MRGMKKYVSMLGNNHYAIYLFHGVIPQPSKNGIRNYNRKHILAEEFEWLIKNLMLSGNPIDLRQLLQACDNGLSLPKRSFSITFDDGFLNNYKFAAPILKFHGCPATFYLASSFINSNLMSWIDRIEHAVDQTDKLKIPFRGENYNISTDAKKIYFMEEVRTTFKSAMFKDLDDEASKIQRYLMEKEVFSRNDNLDAKMTWAHVRELSTETLFNFGGHSHSHGILSHLHGEKLKFEIKKPLQAIYNECSINTEHFSYPEGLDNHFNKRVINVLKNNGIRCCPTAIHGYNDLLLNSCWLYQLRRVSVT